MIHPACSGCFKDVSRDDLSVVAAATRGKKAGDIAFSGREGAASACLSITFLMAIVSPLSSDDGSGGGADGH